MTALAASFVGRERLLAEVVDALRAGQDVVLIGRRGVGASTLARVAVDRAGVPVRVLDDGASHGDTGVLLTIVRDVTEIPAELRRSGRAGAVLVVTVPPLDLAAEIELLASMLGGPVERALGWAVHSRTEGNPLYVRELVAVARRSNALSWSGAAWVLTGELPDVPHLAQFADLPVDRAVNHVIEYVALGDPVPVAVLERLVPVHDIERAERLGFIELTADGMRCSTSLIRDGAQGALGGYARRQRITALMAQDDRHDTLSRLRHVRWRLELGAPVAIAELLEAGLLARDVGREAGFVASALASADDPEQLVLAAQTLAHLHRVEDATEKLAVAARTTTRPEDRLQLEVARAYLLTLPGRSPDAAIKSLAAAFEREGEHPLLMAQRAMSDFIAGRIDDALRVARPLAADPAMPDEITMHALLTVVGCAIALDAPLIAVEALARARPLATRVMAALPEARGAVELYSVLQHAVRSEVAELGRLAELGLSSAEARRDPIRAEYAHLLAWGRLLNGDPESAIPLLLSASAFDDLWSRSNGPWIDAVLVQALVLGGRASAARAMFDALLVGPSTGLQQPYIEAARDLLTAERGDLRGAGVASMVSSAAYLSTGMRAAGIDALYAAVRYGSLDAAESLRRLAPRGTIHRVQVRHARALLAGDVAGLARTAALLGELGLTWYALEAAAQGFVLARNDPSPRRAALARLTELRSAAPDLRSPVVRELLVPGSVTRRERQIAELAAGGFSDREIGQMLGISIRTVGTHLGRVYLKVGADGRAQLGVLLSAAGLA